MGNEEKQEMTALEKIMFQREQREQAEYEQKLIDKAEKEAGRKARLENVISRDKRARDKVIQLQTNCDHLQGQNAQRKDIGVRRSNIYAHQLPDGSIFIKCRNFCGMKWEQNDTKDWLFRKDGTGKIVKTRNHTGLSFADMWARLPQDSLSRSEVPFSMPTQPVEVPAKRGATLVGVEEL